MKGILLTQMKKRMLIQSEMSGARHSLLSTQPLRVFPPGIEFAKLEFAG